MFSSPLHIPRCLRHCGGGFLYQAYGNLYAMAAFGKLLEEIHVTWTQFEKKQDKITTLHEVVSRMRVQFLETASQFLAMPSELTSDGVKIYVTASERNRLKRNTRRFGEAMASGILGRHRGLFTIYQSRFLGVSSVNRVATFGRQPISLKFD
ncbi:hypothetical protein Tco_1164512 [Tanacetum coccineum]